MWFVKQKEEEQNASREEFQQIFYRYYPVVTRQLAAMLGDLSLAEDIAQETFLKLYHSPPPEQNHILGWLKTVAHRQALNHLRGEKSRRQREERVESEVNQSVNMEEIFWRDHQVQSVRRALGVLPPRDRLMLLMRYSGASYEEIAEASEIKKSSVGTILARAQQRFKQTYLREEGDNDLS